MNPAVYGAAAGASERRVLERMREIGAVRPDTAQPLPQDLGRGDVRRARRLVRHGVLRESSPGAYYLDESALADYRGRRRTVALSIILAFAGLIAGLLLAR